MSRSGNDPKAAPHGAKPTARQRLTTEFWRLFRFAITGTVSSLVHYGAYCLALLRLSPTLSYSIGYAAGLVCNYALTTFFTFRQHPSKANAAGFAASHALNYLLEIGLLNLFLRLGASQWLAPLLTMAVAVPINFALLHVVFLHGKRKNSRNVSE